MDNMPSSIAVRGGLFGHDLEFASPAFALLLLVPLLYAAIRLTVFTVQIWRGQTEDGSIPKWRLYHPSAKILHAIWSQMKLPLPKHDIKPSHWSHYLIWALIWCLLTIAAMEPVRLTQRVNQDTEGVDMVLAVDLSRSMLALDMSEDPYNPRTRITRLGVVKQVLGEFIANRLQSGGDRMGLVLFGDNAYVQSALTIDGLALIQMLGQAEIGLAGDSTAIGDALTLGIKMLKDRDAKSKVLILLTDGANTAGTIAPESAAQLMPELGIRFYAISVGKGSQVPFPEMTPLGVRIVMANMETDEGALQNMANLAKGRFFRAADPEALEAIYEQINALETSESDARVWVMREPLFRWPLGFGLGVLCMYVLALRRYEPTLIEGLKRWT